MKGEAEQEYFGSMLQVLGALDWTLVQIVFNVRARTAVGFQQYLADMGIDIPHSLIKSRKWLGAFHRPPSLANHRNGFGGLLRDRLIALGFDEDLLTDAMTGLEHDVLELSLDVESAVARELQRDLETIGVQLPPSILDCGTWRNVLARERGKLPAGAASIVHDGIDTSIFRAVELSACTLT